MKRYANNVFTPVIFLMLFIFTAIIFLSFRQTAEAKASAAMVAHSQEVLLQTANLMSSITENETHTRGFLLTANPAFLKLAATAKLNAGQQIESLRRLTADNPTQQTRIDSLIYYSKARFNFSDSIITTRNKKGLAAAAAAVSGGVGSTYSGMIKALADEMQHEEHRLLNKRKIVNEKATELLKRIIISIIVVIVVFIIILLRKEHVAIFARKEAEEALRKNEAFFELMTNRVKEYAIFMLDGKGRVINWNKGAELVTGYEKQEISGQAFEIFFNQQAIADDEPRRALALAKTYGQFETEGPRQRKDGSTFWASMVIIALINEGGNFYGYSTIIHDITERKKTQEQLEFLSRQINHSHDAIFVVDADRKIKSWNRGAEKLYGYTKLEVLENDPNVILKTGLSEEELNTMLEKLAREDYWTGELKRQTKSGETIYVRSSTTTIRDNREHITGYVAVSFDISGQKKLREQVNHLASLVEQSTEAIVSTGFNGCILSWNSGAEKLFGFSKKEAQGKTLTGLGLTGRQALPAAIKELREQGAGKTEMDFFHKDGTKFCGSVNANTIKNEQGETDAVVFIITDISLRKKLEQQLKQSNEELEQRVKERTEEIYNNEKRFRALIENSAEGIALTDENAHVLYRSPAALKITGELPMGYALNNTHPDDLEMMKNKHGEVLQKPGIPVGFQARFLQETGHYFWLEGTITNLLHLEGVNAIVVNYRDISSRKETEEKLIASEEQFRRTLDNMLEGVQIIGFDWRYIYVNDSMARHGKYPKEEFIGHTVMEKYPGIEQTKIYQVYQRCFKERVAIHLENEFVFPDKTVAWFELSFQPVPEGLFILSVDITDRKKAEEQLIKSEKVYRSLFENMRHGFAYCKGEFENGRLVDYIHLGVNKEFEIITGLGDVTWKKLSDLVPGLLQARPQYAEILGRVALEGGTKKFEMYAEPLGKWFSVSLYSPEKAYFVLLVDNITDRKRIEHKIKKLNAELEKRVIKRTGELKKMNGELEAFSYSVSHDLRAPLRAIIGFTAILEEEYGSKLDEEARRITSVIKRNTLKMGHLIDDLLTFSRMGRQDLLKSRVNTQAMVSEIIQQPDIQQYIDLKPVNWVIHTLPDMHADINTIRQVWINLIANAVKYSGKVEHPRVEIGSLTESGKIIFFVKDNGVGFDEKYKDKLFGVFQRLHAADDFEGTGIGLAIVEKIISKHDGQVWANAELDKGATFYFSLPVNAHGSEETTA